MGKMKSWAALHVCLSDWCPTVKTYVFRSFGLHFHFSRVGFARRFDLQLTNPMGAIQVLVRLFGPTESGSIFAFYCLFSIGNNKFDSKKSTQSIEFTAMDAPQIVICGRIHFSLLTELNDVLFACQVSPLSHWKSRAFLCVNFMYLKNCFRFGITIRWRSGRV